VGGHIAGRLADRHAEVSLIARGAHLAAIQADGLRVETTQGVIHSHPLASDDPHVPGVQDIVIVTVKAPSLPQVASGIQPLLGPDTAVAFVMNGIPWWYFYAHGGPLEGTRLTRIDPEGSVWERVDPARVIGAAAHTACAVTAPGVIRAVNARNRITLGRPDGRAHPRLTALAAALSAAGLEIDVTARIRDAVWEKLLMNLVGGSLGILTASSMGAALSNPAIAKAAHDIAREGAAIARALGCDPGAPEAGLSRLMRSTHKQSILQDLELGRAMEIDALLTVPLELARMTGTDTPTLDLVVGLAVQRARAAGLYGDPT